MGNVGTCLHSAEGERRRRRGYSLPDALKSISECIDVVMSDDSSIDILDYMESEAFESVFHTGKSHQITLSTMTLSEDRSYASE